MPVKVQKVVHRQCCVTHISNIQYCIVHKLVFIGLLYLYLSSM
jgi:hypothetical protein